MRNIYNLSLEPTGEVYGRLILFALQYCDRFQFVVPHHIKQNKAVQDKLKKFENFQTLVTEKSEWPGTKLFSGTATVYQYKLNKESIRLLISCAKSLYSWTQPDSPEDLCLLRTDHTPWLVTIGYERDGYFEITSKEKEEIEAAIPELVLSKQIQHRDN